MELVAAHRPFISIPLANHFEQRFHVRHRLDRYGARVTLDYAQAHPEAVAEAIVGALDSQPRYQPIDPGGATTTGRLIAELL